MKGKQILLTTILGVLMACQAAAASTWSSELVDRTEIAEPYSCDGCDEHTVVWDDKGGHRFEDGTAMPWATPDPLD